MFRFLLFIVLFISLNAQAASNMQHIVVVPVCFAKQLTVSYKTLSQNAQYKLISLNHTAIEQLIEIKHQNKNTCGGFIDVTAAWKARDQNAAVFLENYLESNVKLAHPNQYSIKYEKIVTALLPSINPQSMWENLTTLSNFNDRYANSDNGVAAAQWIKNHIESLAKNNNRNDVTVSFIQTGSSYKQPSVVAKIGNGNGPGVVIGAHMDTLNGLYSKKPGADDDGSGSVAVIEVARTLLTSGHYFKNPIYLIWYAAEEEGLVGSGYVVSEFKNKNIPINAVLQFDVIGYAYKNDLTMWVVDDYVNKDLTNYLVTLINTYVKRPVKHTQCGYACSDHASWSLKGYAASIACEAAYENSNPYMHTSLDTMDKISLTHITDFTKLATSFAVELAEPIS